MKAAALQPLRSCLRRSLDKVLESQELLKDSDGIFLVGSSSLYLVLFGADWRPEGTLMLD